MTTLNRRYDIDWLRVIAIGLLLIYHIAIAFQPWGVIIGFIQNDQPLVSIWTPMSMLNVWRIPLLFFVSGMGVAFAMKKRTWKQLLLERSKRILLPFLFGMLFIVPIHFLLWQNYYHQDLKYILNPSHLWFLGNIFIYVLILLPMFNYLRKNKDSKTVMVLKSLYKSPLGLILLIIPFIVEVLLIKPETFELYAFTLHGYVLGFLAFFVGFSFIISGSTLWNTLLKWRLMFLVFAIIIYVIRIVQYDLNAPKFLVAIESNLWILALLGFAFKYLNRPSKALRYLSQAAYPIYIIHMAFLFMGSIIIMPLELPATVKFVLLVIFTNLGCFVIYEFIIRRIKFIRPLFGLK